MAGLATMLLNSLLHKKKTSLQTFPRSIKLLFFSVGLISILFIFIGVLAPSSYDMVLLTLKKAWFFVRQLLSSPFFICIIINFIVIFIAASYVMETRTNHFHGNNDSVSATSIYYHDYDLQLENTLAPSNLPPPIDAVPFKNNVGSHQICQDDIFTHQKTHSLDCTAEIVKAQEPGRSERIKKSENKSNGLRKAPENERKSGLENIKTVETDDTMEATWRAITEGGAKTEKRDTWAQPIFSQENTEEMDSEVPKSGHVLQSTLAPPILPPKNNMGSHQICQDEIFAHLTKIKENRKPYSLDNTAEIGKSERIKKGQNKSNGQQIAPEITKTVETDDTMEATWRAITEGGAKTEKRDTWAQPIFSQENTEEMDSEVPKSGHVLQSTLAESILPPKNNMGSHQICQDEIFAHLTKIKENRKPYSLDNTAEIGKAQEPGISERIKKGQNKSNEQRIVPQITKTVETDDTMEATWRAIKKTDTWDQPIYFQENTEEKESEELLVSKSGNVSKELRKSMTFNETVSLRFRGGMMRGPSISLEELHGRVEAHIKNFNNEMRLQRQESEQRYQEMLNRNI